MNDIEDIRRRMRISNLHARCEVHEIEAAALTREVASPLTSSQRRAEAIERRDAALTELFEIKAELDEMLRSFQSKLRLSRIRILFTGFIPQTFSK
jgi:hypothetical protein